MVKLKFLLVAFILNSLIEHYEHEKDPSIYSISLMAMGSAAYLTGQIYTIYRPYSFAKKHNEILQNAVKGTQFSFTPTLRLDPKGSLTKSRWGLQMVGRL